MSQAEKTWRLNVVELSELLKMVDKELSNYPADSTFGQAVSLNTLRKKLFFEMLNHGDRAIL